MNIHESAEDYLEAILILKERQGLVRSIDTVREKNFSKPSVSIAMKRLRENGCMLESNSTATHLQVAHGTYAVGICMDYIVSNMEEAGEPISFRLPERDTVPIYSPMGLVAGCPNERNGRLLYDYILSKEGQTILTEHHLHSIRDDLGNTPDSIQTVLDSRLPVNEQEISDTMEDVMDRFDRIFFQD